LGFAALLLSFVFLGIEYYNGYVYGVDSWYWVKVMYQKPLISILFTGGLLIALYSYLGPKRFAFLMSMFFISFRLFINEADDYLFYLINMIILMKIDEKKGMIYSLAVGLLYGFVHGFWISGTYYVESVRNIVAILMPLPLYAHAIVNRDWKYLVIAVFLMAVGMTPKMAATGLFPLTFLYVMHRKPRALIVAIFLFFMFTQLYNEYKYQMNVCVDQEKYCANGICNPTVDWCGHYLAYKLKNYIINVTTSYGINCCVGSECFYYWKVK